MSKSNKKFFDKLRFSAKVRLNLYQKLAKYTESGISLNNGLLKIAGMAKKRRRTAYLGRMLSNWSSAIGDGKSFSEAISGWAPESEMMLIRSGEESGHLVEAMGNAIEMTGASKKMKSTVISSLSYPCIALTALVVIVILFSVAVVPQLADLKDPSEWPASSQSLHSLSTFIVELGWLAGLGFVGLVSAAIYSLPRYAGQLRPYLDKIPPWSIYKAFQSSVFLVSVSSLMKTGVPLVDAIEGIGKLSSPYIRKHLKKMVSRMNAGVGTGAAMNTGFLSEEIAGDIEVYSELSNLQDNMNFIGKQAIEDGVNNISTASKVVMYLILLAIAAFIIWAFLSFTTLMQSIGKPV